MDFYNTDFEAKITVRLIKAATDTFSGKPLPNFYEATQQVGDARPRKVFAKVYDEGINMKLYFKKLQNMQHDNILDALTLASNGKQQVITFEPVSGSLESYIEANKGAVLTKIESFLLTQFQPNFISKLRGAISGVFHIHRFGICHGPLFLSGIYVTDNGKVKLGLGAYESEFILPDWTRDPGSKLADAKYIGELLKQIFLKCDIKVVGTANCPNDLLEISHLITGLCDGILVCEADILREPSLWTLKHKWAFASGCCRVLDKFSLSSIHIPGWRKYFDKPIMLLPKQYRSYFSDTLEYYLRYFRNNVEHLNDVGMEDAKNHFGGDEERVIRAIQWYHPLLFVQLIPIAVSQNKFELLVLHKNDGTYTTPLATGGQSSRLSTLFSSPSTSTSSTQSTLFGSASASSLPQSPTSRILTGDQKEQGYSTQSTSDESENAPSLPQSPTSSSLTGDQKEHGYSTQSTSDESASSSPLLQSLTSRILTGDKKELGYSAQSTSHESASSSSLLQSLMSWILKGDKKEQGYVKKTKKKKRKKKKKHANKK